MDWDAQAFDHLRGRALRLRNAKAPVDGTMRVEVGEMPGWTRRLGRGVRRVLAGTVAPVLVAGVLAAAVPGGAQAATARAAGGAASGRKAGGPVALSAFAASAQAKKTGKPVVASALTTPTSVTTAKPGGIFTATESLVPVRAFRSGKWQALNPALHENANRTVSPAVTTGGLMLSGGGSGPLAVLSSHGRSMSLWWPGRLPVPALSGATATYANVLPGVNLAVTADAQGGLSDVLVIKDAAAAANPALRSLRLRVSAPGLKVTANRAGNLRVAASAKAEPVFTAQPPQMWDSAPPAAGTVVPGQNGALLAKPSGLPAYSSQAGPGAAARVWQVPLSVAGNTITLAPPHAALAARGAVYPLYIDPSFEPDPVNENNSAWTEVQSGFPNNTADWDESSNLQVGLCDFSYCNGMGVARSFFAMPMPPELTTSTSINSADIYMTENWAPSCTKETIELRPTGGIGTGTSWNNQPGWSSTTLSQVAGFGYPGCNPPDGYYTNDITWNVASVIAGDAGHVGSQTWGLMAGSESDDRYWKQFNSGSSAITMSVSYHNPPKQPAALQNSPAGACKTSVGSESAIGADDVTLSAVVGDVDNGNGDDSLTTTFTVINGTTSHNLTVNSGNAAGGLTVSYTIPRTTIEGWSSGSTAYHWYATTKDAGSPVLTSQQSETCYFLFNPQGPAAPGVSLPPPTVTIGTAFSETFSPPSGCGSPTSPCPVSYTYQLGVSAPVTVSVNNAPAPGDWTGNITMTQVGPAQLTVYGVANGGTPGTSSTQEVTGDPPSSPYPDGYFTGGSYPSLLTKGPGADPSLWLSAGTGNGTLAPAVDIGSLGTGINPGGDNGPADWANAEVLHGEFTGNGVEDVMAYYPPGTSNAGNGTIIEGPGDASPLMPVSGKLWNISNVPLVDPTYVNPTDNPSILVGAGDAGEQATGADDLIGILGDTSGSDTYELDLFSVSGACQGGNVVGQYSYCATLSTTAPDGTMDWNNYALATVQPGGNPNATAADTVVLFALDKATGALYESVNPTCTATVTSGCEAGSSSTLIGMPGSTWTTISTPWGSNAPSLVSADVNSAGSIELWTLSGSAATPYKLSGTTLTLENSGAPLASSQHDWQLTDGNSYAQGSGATTATDSISGASAAISSACTISCFWQDDDFFGTVANLDGVTGGSNPVYSYIAPPAGIIPSTATSASISLWFKTTAANGVLVSYNGSPPSNGNITANYDPVLYVGTDGKLQSEWWPAGLLSSKAQVDDGVWHHVVLIDNGSRQTLTLDGVTQGTSSGAASFTYATPGYLDFGFGYLGGNWPDELHYQQNGTTAYPTDFVGQLADVTLNPPGTSSQACSPFQAMQIDGGTYDIEDNTWTGTACLQTDEGDDFTVSSASISSTGSPGGYPEIWSGCHIGSCTVGDGQAGQLPIQVSDLGDMTSSWTTTLPTTGTYNAQYNVWFNTTATPTGQPNGGLIEISPGENGLTHGTSVATIDGTSWYVSQFTETANGVTFPVVVYQRVTQTTSLSNLDLRNFTRDAVVRGVVSPSSYLTSVEAGYAIWQGSGSPGLSTSSFSVNPATGTPTGPVVTALSATKCINDAASGTTVGNPINIYDCNGTGGGAQNWAVSMDGTIQVTINGTTMCMGLLNNAPTSGTDVALETCNGSTTEIWEPGAAGALWNEASNLCLADPQSNLTNGTQLIISSCDGGSEQNWTLPTNAP